MSPYAPAPGATPPGKIEKPSTLVILTIVTLTIYFYVWLWRVTGEIDAWVKRPGWTRNLALATIALAALGILVTVVTLALDIGPILAASQNHAAYTPPSYRRWLPVAGLLGQLVAIACLFRVWSTLAERAKTAGRPAPNPQQLALLSCVAPVGSIVGIALGGTGSFGLGTGIGAVISFVGEILWLVVLAQTQKALNEAWQAEATSAPAAW